MKCNMRKLLIVPLILCNLFSCSSSNSDKNLIIVDKNTNLNYYIYNDLYKFYDYEIKEIYHINDNCEVAKINSHKLRNCSKEIINGIEIYRDDYYVFVVNKNNIIYSLTDAYTNLIISNDDLINLNKVLNYNDFYDKEKFKNATTINNIILEEKNYDVRYYPGTYTYVLEIDIDINFCKHIFTEEDFNFISFDNIYYRNAWAHEKFLNGTYIYESSLTHPRYEMRFSDLESRTKAIDYLIDNKPYFIKNVSDSNPSAV